MNKEIFPFVESEEYSFYELKTLLPSQLFIDGLCSKKQEKVQFKFSGIVVFKRGIIVVFPKGYNINIEEYLLKKHILTLINTLIRYRQEKGIDEYESKLLGGVGENESIGAALWILDDYFNQGLIHKKEEKHSKNDSGNINWSRTIKQIQPAFSNSRPIYLDFITKKRNTDFTNILYIIHRYAVAQALYRYGWIFGYDSEHEIIDLLIDKKVAIHHLQIELQQTFNDREVKLYQNLIEFLKGNSESTTQDKIVTFLTPHFHTVWEKICDFIFGGIKDNEIIIPRPFWKVNNNKMYTKQVPDTIFITSNKLFILDAKYYRIKKLPGWGDLVKQFFYANTLKNLPYEIKNILLFPSSNDDQKIKYLGYAEIEDNKQFGRINGYTVDIYKAMKYYSNYYKGDFHQLLVNLENKKL